MPTHLIQPLPYFEDSAVLFSSIAGRPWAVFLDSGHPSSQQGRFDILACDPLTTLVTHGGLTKIVKDGIEQLSPVDPFTLLKQELPNIPPAGDLPFNCGAIGYFGYDLARRIEKLPELAFDAEQIPEMAVGIYHWAVIIDHQQQQSWLVSFGISDAESQRLFAQFSRSPLVDHRVEFSVTGKIVSNMDHQGYELAFNKIKHYLLEGDCYQVNLAQRFEAPCQGDTWTAYRLLRESNAAPFSAYLNHPELQILCSSPERFLKVTQTRVETKPIKGTRPRKQDPLEDQAQIEALSESRKDQAENVMIVDLLRNDISKNCREGSVKVPSLFAVESYATVHHLVSTVTGELAEGQHALDLLRSCFPGGSITGAPKIRAMEIIEELEPHRRGVYCGAIGYIGFDGNMIPIL